MSRKRAIGIVLTSCLLFTGSIASAKKKKQPAADAAAAVTSSPRRVAARRSAISPRRCSTAP